MEGSGKEKRGARKGHKEKMKSVKYRAVHLPHLRKETLANTMIKQSQEGGKETQGGEGE